MSKSSYQKGKSVTKIVKGCNFNYWYHSYVHINNFWGFITVTMLYMVMAIMPVLHVCWLRYVFLFHCGLHWMSYCPTCSVGALLYYYIIISYRMQREMNRWRKLIDTWQHCMRFVSKWYLVTVHAEFFFRIKFCWQQTYNNILTYHL